MNINLCAGVAPGAAPVYAASIIWLPIADDFPNPAPRVPLPAPRRPPPAPRLPIADAFPHPESRASPLSPVLLFLLLLLVIPFLIQILILLLLSATRQEQDLPSRLLVPLFPIPDPRNTRSSRSPRPDPRFSAMNEPLQTSAPLRGLCG